ncbi:hypothetical protein ACWDLG_13105 [Nonomuraea sp. NPDC003727]
MFDLSGPWTRVLADTRLHHGPAMQSLAVDPVTHELYLVQLRDTAGKITWVRLDGFSSVLS